MDKKIQPSIKVIITKIILVVLLFIFIDYFLFVSRCSCYTGNGSGILVKLNSVVSHRNHSSACFFTNKVDFFTKFPRFYTKQICNRKYFATIESFDELYKNAQMRKPIIYNNAKDSVIVFGCSFAYGDQLQENQTFSYKLAKLTKRSVINRAYPSWRVQQMLYQLRKDDYYKWKNPAKYVVYIFIPDHVRRISSLFFDPTEGSYNLQYLGGPSNVLSDTSKLTSWRFLYLLGLLNEREVQFSLNHDFNRNFDSLEQYFVESKKITDKKFPNSKFIILKYLEMEGSEFLYTSRWKELEKKGFTIIDTKSLTGKNLYLNKYKLPDGHPNEKAWDLITPALAKRLNL